MKKIYIECNMGVAGDMLCGALLDTLDSDKRNKTINKLNSLFSHIDISCKSESKCGICGTKFNVQIEEEHHSHNSLSEIYGIIDSLDISDNVKENAKAVYKIIADAESKVHGMPVCDIHLHEVGAKDAIADTVSCCYLFELIGADKITASPLTTGYGEVKCAHGILSVPAPATAEILKGIKTRRGDTESELTTPTGAALIKHFADEISEQCDMAFEAVGYGMGTKNFEKPNCVRRKRRSIRTSHPGGRYDRRRNRIRTQQNALFRRKRCIHHCDIYEKKQTCLYADRYLQSRQKRLLHRADVQAYINARYKGGKM